MAERGKEIDARGVFWFDQGMSFRSLQWLQYYYFASALFLLINWLAGANVRAVGFAAYPTMRMVYYLVCLLCGMVVRLLPAWSAPVTLAESSVNITITALMISVPTPLSTFDVENPSRPPVAFPQLAINFMISGTAALVTWYQCLYALPGLRPR
ncbi:MAG: hypothetical protein HY038_05050 [Nitrospirae bacterium]|nr:hypothetical protein [Nitrospirota bacterium]